MPVLVAVTDHAAERYRQRVRGTLDPKLEVASAVSRAYAAGRVEREPAGTVRVRDAERRDLVYVCRQDGAELIVVTLWEEGDEAAVPRRFTDALRPDDRRAPMRQVTRPRVCVRAPAPADRHDFLAAMRSSRRYHRPWLTAPTTDEAFDVLLSRAENPAFAPMLVCRLEDGAIAGFINISHIVRGPFQSAYLGYGGVAAFARQGYMREGLELVLARAFTDLRLHRLEANIQPGNHASIALVRGAGFVREGFSERYLKIGGRWRDHDRWAIRVEQWRARRSGR